MAQIVVSTSKERFYAIRKLLRGIKYYQHRGNGRGSFVDEYTRKRIRKQEQIELFKSDDRFRQFFEWIFSIQNKLQVNNNEFANLCNVSPQTVSSWKQFDGPNGGQFPSKDAFKRLIRLEIVAEANIVVKRRRIPIRDKGLPIPKIKMPRRRLSAKYYN